MLGLLLVASSVLANATPAETPPAGVTVITRQQIQDMNAQTLREVLNVFVPGVEVVPAYAGYSDRVTEGVFARGMLTDSGQHTLVLFNGQAKFNESTFGSTHPALEFTLENVERIEVSRSADPRFGPGALTVINLVTREQFKEGVEAALTVAGGGSDGLRGLIRGRKLGVVWGTQVADAWKVGGSAQAYDNAGFSSPVPEPEFWTRDGTRGAANATLSVSSPKGRFTAQSWFKYGTQDATHRWPVSSPSSDHLFYRGSQWLTQATVRPNEQLELKLGALASYWSNFSVRPWGFLLLPEGTDVYNYDLFADAQYRASVALGGAHQLLGGVRLEREGQYGVNDYRWEHDKFLPVHDAWFMVAPNASRTIASLYIEDDYRVLENVSLTATLRGDWYSGFGAKSELLFTPRVCARVSTQPGLVLQASYARVGRPPSLYERLGYGLPGVGTASVRAERLDSFDVSAQFVRDGVKARLTGWLQRLQGKIEYLDDGTGLVQASNNGNTRALGTDLELNWTFAKRSYAFFNGSVFRSVDETTGARSYFLPFVYVNGGVNLFYGRFDLNLVASYRGSRLLPAELERSQRFSGPMLRLNTSLTYEVAAQARVFGQVENVTNAQSFVPVLPLGAPVPLRGRTLLVGVEYRL